MPAYVTPEEVADSLFVKIKDAQNNIVNAFSTTTRPSINTINRLIGYASFQLDKRTGQSWDDTSEHTEVLVSNVDFYKYGVILKTTRQPIVEITSFEKRDRWDKEWEAVPQDAYTVENEIGEINIISSYFQDAEYRISYMYGFEEPNELVKNIVIKRITIEMYNMGYLTENTDPNKKSQLIMRLENEIKRDTQSLMRMYAT